MRIALTVLTFLCGVVAHAAHLAPWNPGGKGMCFGMSANDDGVVIRRTTADGTDAAIAGYYTMVNGIPYDTLTSQGLQAVGVSRGWANGVDAGISMAGTMGVGAAARTAGRVVVATPYGNAIQSSSHAALDSLSNVRNGSTVYRTGTLGIQNISEGQFWALKNPLVTSGYAEQYGLPTAWQGYKFVVGGTIKNSARVVTREAPGLGANAGGAIEVVTPPKGVMLNWFHMP